MNLGQNFPVSLWKSPPLSGSPGISSHELPSTPIPYLLHFEGSLSGLNLLQLVTERFSWRFGTAVSSMLELHQTTESMDQVPNPHKSQRLSLNVKTQACPCHVCLLSHNSHSPAQLFPVGISVSQGTVAITAVLFHLNTYLSSCPKCKHFISTSSPWLQPTALAMMKCCTQKYNVGNAWLMHWDRWGEWPSGKSWGLKLISDVMPTKTVYQLCSDAWQGCDPKPLEIFLELLCLTPGPKWCEVAGFRLSLREDGCSALGGECTWCRKWYIRLNWCSLSNLHAHVCAHVKQKNPNALDFFFSGGRSLKQMFHCNANISASVSYSDE